MSKPALGRGLGALLGGGGRPSAPPPAALAPLPSASVSSGLAAAAAENGVRKVSLDRVVPSPLQPRRDFTEESLRELADSIREQGIIQPLVVRPVGERLELIAGERRWRAARLAGLSEVPVIERPATDREVLELALIENLQRENLNPIEGLDEPLRPLNMVAETTADDEEEESDTEDLEPEAPLEPAGRPEPSGRMRALIAGAADRWARRLSRNGAIEPKDITLIAEALAIPEPQVAAWAQTQQDLEESSLRLSLIKLGMQP